VRCESALEFRVHATSLEFRPHKTQLTNSRSYCLHEIEPPLGRGELAGSPFEIADEGGRAEWPTGLEVLAQRFELPAR
jgi:hypothetical protein